MSETKLDYSEEIRQLLGKLFKDIADAQERIKQQMNEKNDLEEDVEAALKQGAVRGKKKFVL